MIKQALTVIQGSMPTDGTLLLEHMPNGKKYLVTALSVFFSFGSVLSAVVALLVLPRHSCPPDSALICDVATQNNGWKYLLISLGLIVRSPSIYLDAAPPPLSCFFLPLWILTTYDRHLPCSLPEWYFFVYMSHRDFSFMQAGTKKP